jgi:3-phenylpropionate/cinnamic acid dioxygenase small subunit
VTHEEQVQWLVDRAQISDLLHDFARALDTRDWEAYAATYAEDGVLELPWATLGRDELVAFVSGDAGRFHATHHISSNHSIEIDGDVARSRSYVLAMHVLDPGDQSTQWLGGGWYDNEYRRTADGWRLTRVRITPVWDIGARPPSERDHA